jgi:6-phosphofructokinase 1
MQELKIEDVSRIPRQGGSILATSRANPTKSQEMLDNVVNILKKYNVGYLVTIGGDDTANSAKAISAAANDQIHVGHVPKTIDNDLPLPGRDVTFGFHTACEAGTSIVETLQTDAQTTGRWYLVVAMGRKAGHLALGIGTSAGATLTIIPEDFEGQKVPLSRIADTIVASMIKRRALNRQFGVVVLAEGIAECLDPESIPNYDKIERDPHGNIRFAELDFGYMVKAAVKNRMKEFGVEGIVVDKNVGYELRCGSPVAFDRIYTQQLGCGVIDALIEGSNGIMITRQHDDLVPVNFEDIIDPETGKTKIRMVDTSYLTYQVARKYMIRLSEKDLKNREFVELMAAQTNLSSEQLVSELAYIADPHTGYEEH